MVKYTHSIFLALVELIMFLQSLFYVFVEELEVRGGLP